MAFNKYLCFVLLHLCMGSLQSQEMPQVFLGDSAKSLQISPAELSTSSLLNHNTTDTLILLNTGSQDINWYVHHSFSWLQPKKTLDTLKVGEIMKLPLEMRVEDLPIAIYTDSLFFRNSKTYELLAVVPVEIMLEARPHIYIPLRNFSATVFENGYKKIDFTIENRGNTELDYSLYTDVSVPWLKAMDPTQGVLGPGESQQLSLLASGAGIASGDYEGNAWISSNDPNQARSFIQVKMALSTESKALISDLNKSSLCRGETFEIPYEFKKVILGKGNQIVAELSDKHGSFKNPTLLGSMRSQELAGTLSVETPRKLEVSDGYKIRLRSTDPKLECMYDNRTLQVGKDAEVHFSSNIEPFCDTDEKIVLMHALPTGGTYTGPGIYNGFFSPRRAGPGIHQIHYTYIDKQGCSLTADKEVLVRESPRITHRPVDLICIGTDALVLSGGKPAGGYYTGTGIETTGNLIMNDLKPGVHTVTYVLEQATCKSEVDVSFQLAEAPEKPELVQQGNQLVCQKLYQAYHWFNNGQSINNANQSVYTPTSYGEFTLLVRNEVGCSQVSNPVMFKAPDISNAIWKSLQIGPNPALDHLVIEGEIEGSEHPARIHMVISDEKGRSIIEASYGNIRGKFKREVVWQGLQPGVYELSLEWEGNRYEHRVVIAGNESGD